MLKVGQLFALLGLDKRGFDAGLNSAKTDFSGLASSLTNIGGALTAGVTVPLAAIAYKAVQASGEMEQLTIAFTQFLGSRTAAEAYLKTLQDFANVTPFELKDVAAYARTLMGAGEAAERVIPILTSVGDAVAASGKGPEAIESIVRALTQMKGKTKVSAEEMMQLAEAGVTGAWQMIADKLGVSVAQAMKMSERGMIDAETGINALLDGMEKRFHGSMAAQSKSLFGLWSTLMDQLRPVFQSIGDNLLRPLIDIGMGIAGQVLPRIRAVLDAISKMPTGFKVFLGMLGVAAAALGPILLAAGGIAGLIVNLSAAGTLLAPVILPIVAPILAIVAGVTAVAAGIYLAYTRFKPFRDAVKGLWDSLKQMGSALWENLKPLWGIIAPIASGLGKALGAGLGVALTLITNILSVVAKVVTYLLSGTSKVLNVIVSVVQTIADAITFVAEMIGKAFGELYKPSKPTLVQGLLDVSIAAIKAQMEMDKLNKKSSVTSAPKLKLITDEEANSILKLIEKRKEDIKAEQERRRQMAGFVNIGDIARNIALAGVRGTVPSANASSELTMRDMPTVNEIRRMHETIKRQAETQQRMLQAIKEGVGGYGA